MPVWMTQRLVPSSEFSEWLAMEKVEPLDAQRDDWRVALSTAQIINHLAAALGAKTKVTAKDMLLEFQDSAHQYPSKAELRMKLMSWLGPRRKKG